jgi:hypothetical protein
MTVLVEENPPYKTIRAAFEAKRDHPGIKIVSFRSRRCLHPNEADSATY